jgi:hypothetical protein
MLHKLEIDDPIDAVPIHGVMNYNYINGIGMWINWSPNSRVLG